MNNLLKFAEELCKQKMAEYNLIQSGWSFRWNNRKKSFGLCNYTTKTIELSKISNIGQPKEDIINTILHEIAHALTPGEKHNYKWRKMFIKLGGDGKRCGNASNETKDIILQVAKYQLVCKHCGYTHPIHRKLKRNKSCGRCSPNVYNEKYKMDLIQNK